MNGHIPNGNISKTSKVNGHSVSLNGVSNTPTCQNPRNGSGSPRCLEKPFLIGVAGGTASGKASVCARIMEKLGQNKVDQKERRVVTVSMDSFYHPLTVDDESKALKGQFNFDHPDAFDHDLIARTIKDITACRTVRIPIYDIIHYKFKPDEYQTIYPADVVIFEGILLFYFPEICNLFDMKLFVDTDADTRLSRRVIRDTENDRNIEQILYQYTTFVKPAFEEFCLPTKKFADVIIPRGADNTIAVELIVQHIQDLLQATPLHRLALLSTGAADMKSGKIESSTGDKQIHRVPSVADASRPH